MAGLGSSVPVAPVAIFFAAEKGDSLGALDLGPVSPGKPLLLSTDVAVPAKAVRVSLAVCPDMDKIDIELASTAIKP